MSDHIEKMPAKYKSIMLDRAENLLHEHFGDAEYWSARRSARFSKNLVKIANEFRKSSLNSVDKKDNTVLPENWETHIPDRGYAIGGPYLCAHLRRKDYTYSRKDSIPDLKSAADQLKRKCKEHRVETVFISTDAPPEEVEELKRFLSGIKVNKFLSAFYG